MKSDGRRHLLLTGFRLAAAAGIGALALRLGLRRRTKDTKVAGYCDRAGRCGGCAVTADCDVWLAMHGGPGHGR